MTKQYGIKVPMAKDDYVWVRSSRQEALEPQLYKTKEQARAAAVVWGPLAVVAEWTTENAYTS